MKAITRTITTYTYTTGNFDPAAMKVTNMQQHTVPYKLGQRERRKVEKIVGSPIIAETTAEQLYSMSLDDFIKYATPVTAEEAAATETDTSDSQEDGEPNA